MHYKLTMNFQTHLTLRHLRLVKVVGRELSLSRAAEILHTSQPAISRALSEIESVLNARLFDRSTRKVSPTAIGRTLIWHAERILGDIDQAQADFSALTRGAVGGVKIGVLRAFSPQLLAVAVQLMREQAPEVEIVIEEGLADDLLAALMENRVDLILSHLELPKTERDLLADPIYRDSVGVVAALRHPLVRQRRVAWSELATEKWVLPRPGTTVRTALDRVLRLNAPGKLPTIVESTSLHFMLALVRECNMLTALPMSVVRWFADDLQVAARIDVRGEMFDWPICATRIRTRRVSGAALLFIDCVKTAASHEHLSGFEPA
jgi:DNA-binding transcriptional LysR family regulator